MIWIMIFLFLYSGSHLASGTTLFSLVIFEELKSVSMYKHSTHMFNDDRLLV